LGKLVIRTIHPSAPPAAGVTSRPRFARTMVASGGIDSSLAFGPPSLRTP
jgi:hypothetical protein